MMPDVYFKGALDFGADKHLWVSQAESVSFKPLVLAVSQGYSVNLLRVRGAGVLSRQAIRTRSMHSPSSAAREAPGLLYAQYSTSPLPSPASTRPLRWSVVSEHSRLLAGPPLSRLGEREF
jgi:hypothetical protein